MFDINQIRQDFPNLHRQVNAQPLIYLDNAASTFKPKVVIDAVQNHYTNEVSNVHRGVHFLSGQATQAYEGSRSKIAQFINSPKDSQIIFTKGTTDAINLVASTYGKAFLGEGDEIVITYMEHHSNIVPWQMLCEEKGCVLKVAPVNDSGELIWEEFEKLLSEKTKFVSAVYVSNSLGTINPVEKIISAAHGVGAKVLIDAAQAVSYQRIDVQKLDCDFLAFSGHKLYGPTGTGVLFGKEELLDAMPPYQGGGDMINHVSFEKTTFNILPYKFEAGTPNIAGFIGLGAAIDYVGGLDWDAMNEHKKNLLALGTQALSMIEGLRLIGTASQKTSVMSFVIDGAHAHDIGTILDEQGVAVRTGHHCTEPLMKRFGVTATTRASIAMYNTEEEVKQLSNAIKAVKNIFG